MHALHVLNISTIIYQDQGHFDLLLVYNLHTISQLCSSRHMLHYLAYLYIQLCAAYSHVACLLTVRRSQPMHACNSCITPRSAWPALPCCTANCVTLSLVYL